MVNWTATTARAISPSHMFCTMMKTIAVSAWPPSSAGETKASPVKPPIGSTSSLIMVAISADFTDTHLHIVLNTVLSSPTWSTASFNGLIFTVLSGPPGLTGADVTGATTMAGFTDSRVTLPGNQIRIDWNGLSYVDGTVVDIDFTAVPEPASLALLGGGLLGLGMMRRRRKAG